MAVLHFYPLVVRRLSLVLCGGMDLFAHDLLAGIVFSVPVRVTEVVDRDGTEVVEHPLLWDPVAVAVVSTTVAVEVPMAPVDRRLRQLGIDALGALPFVQDIGSIQHVFAGRIHLQRRSPANSRK